MIAVKILLTNKCNYNCTFCHDEFQSREDRDDCFDMNKICNVISEHISKFQKQPLSFKFSGGEPTKEWDSLLKLLDISHQYQAQKRILISNLSLLDESQIEMLVGKGINEVRVNVPSYEPDIYKRFTGGNTIDRTLVSMRYFKEKGCNVRVNSVLTMFKTEQEVCSHMSEMIRKSKELNFIDKINFIADFYAENKDMIYISASKYLKGIDNAWTFRRGRIYDGKSDDLIVSVSRCLDRANNEKDNTEIYIVPDGRILSNYVLKR